MADFIVIRLKPAAAVAPATFASYLAGLTVNVFDASFGSPNAGVPPDSTLPIGTATYNAPTFVGLPVPVGSVLASYPPGTTIAQHFSPVVIFANVVAINLESVATAVIPYVAPAAEYPKPNSTPDLRVQFQRAGAQTVVDPNVYYDVTLHSAGAAPAPDQYRSLPASDVGAYVTLPPPPSPNLAPLQIPTDGTPPKWGDLVVAVNMVLASDPGSGQDLAALISAGTPLTIGQCKNIAYEIVWGAQPPIPSLPVAVESMFTTPPNDGSLTNANEQSRQQFEGELAGYYATRNAIAERLSGFIYAASAAVACEKQSHDATQAGLTFPLITGAASPTTIPQATVLLTGTGAPPAALSPDFTVPGAFYYALGATLPPQVTPEQRYEMAGLDQEQHLLKQLETAVEAGIITASAVPLIFGGSAINADQAARRLHALGLTTAALPEVTLAGAPLTTLVGDWLQHAGPSTSINADFWANEVVSQPGAYLDLILHAVTENHAPLITAIKGPPHNVTTVAGLVTITDKQWRDFFLYKFDQPGDPPPPPTLPGEPPRMALLPPFTQPGTPAERVEAFIRHLRKFFAVPFALSGPLALSLNAAPTLGLSIADVFAAFTNAYAVHAGGPFVFGTPSNAGALQQALVDVFPGDAQAQAWLKQALETIDALFRMTDLGPALKELQFSLMEALYARGFTDAHSVQAWSRADFREALTGTVAYPHAPAIWVKAGAEGPAPGPAEGGFKPINPDGLLTDCIPPLHLSSIGPVEYLAEMLRVSPASTCDEPFFPGSPDRLGEVLAGRRGPLGSLHATRANLATPLPMIDLVNESLEALTDGLPAATGGAVYDTAGDELFGHKLSQDGGVAGGDSFLHDPQTLFAAVSEHSSPATPVKKPGAYNKLKIDFTSPILPYAQSLDVCRTYLGHLRTSRYAVMRRFRKDITEFVIDPVNEPVDFQRHLWRYPVRIEIAREYLGISPEEHDLLYSKNIGTPGGLVLHELFGFPNAVVNGTSWIDLAIKVPEFLRRTGLTYCEFIELWRAEFVEFARAGENQEFPDCEPCCLDDLSIEFVQPEDPIEGLKRLAVFFRLWRTLRHVKGAKYSFVELCDICNVLKLFRPDGTVNLEFIRQLAAFQILRDHFGLALTDQQDNLPGVGAERTHLLALWDGTSARKWAWAVDELLDRIQHYAKARHKCGCRPPEFIKLLAENLDPLSHLIGFDPNVVADSWHALPTHTLRFAEVLAKLYASEFGVGEVLFLFTVHDHLRGDDPFPLQPDNEALDSPLGLPDDEDQYSLWALRRKLLAVEATDEEAYSWTWTRIEASLREEFGYAPTASDPLRSIAEHFFPKILETSESPADPLKRQYRVSLTTTSAAMWNTPPDGPFRYDFGAQELWTQLPLTDEAVLAKLSRIRQLNADEQKAVRELYFLPRADLAPFAFIFTSFGEAEESLIQEPDEQRRWAYFRREFARCHARSRVIAEHLAQHVAGVTGQDQGEGAGLAWRLLTHLFADENRATTTWELDAGTVPPVTWGPQPNGGAFAALLGLTGTGVLGEFTPEDASHKLIWEDDKLLWEKVDVVWREVRGPMDAFGPEENAWNGPIPTVVPAMGLTLSQDQLRFVDVRNGFALANADGAMLGGAQGFAVRWTGAVLVESEGSYEFRAGAPTPDGEAPDFEAAEDRRWRVTLKRGQKSWFVLSHHWPDVQAPAACSAPLTLRRGAYQLTVEFIQPHPTFAPPDETCPQTTGFQLKYSGPDSACRLVAIPLDKLFRERKDERLDLWISPPLVGAAADFLKVHFTSTLRDIRRTYQRAFKSLLFAHRFNLSAKPVADDGQSEIGYMLSHFDDFAGTSYFRNPPASSSFSSHKAHFDFNFLPILDNYLPPATAQDQRVQPSVKRRQALFDWWERAFDYAAVRREAQTAPERPVWFLFHEAAENHPDDPAHLLRHMGVDITHAPLVLHYLEGFLVSSADLEDDRWAARVWQAEKWIRALLLCFLAKDIRESRPDLWASDDPNVVLPSETESGNQNLTRFVRDGCFENREPRRYQDVTLLNNGLRERARAVLLAYLCGMDRVLLPWGGYAKTPRDLSALLLQDVEVGICQRASRIEEAISAVQAFVQRARLGLEAGFAISQAFTLLWDRHFATFAIWEICKRREVYRENWIDWDELENGRKTEAFRFLESELRRSTLTVPVPGGLEYWSAPRPPIYPGLMTLQSREPAGIQFLRSGPVPEALDLLGIPERDVRPSWLAPVHRATNGGEDGDDDVHPGVTALPVSAGMLPAEGIANLPLWIQAAIRLGTRFIRLAAAALPPASTTFSPRHAKEAGCCVECGRVHPPVIDEYYFWLQDSRYFDEVEQHADQGILSPADPTSDWHREDELPGMLHWDSGPMVHLFWCRVHNGEFKQPRRSDEGLRIDPNLLAPGVLPQLDFKGRTVDSLRFEVSGGLALPGYLDPTPPGFRYELATDSAVVLPLIAAPKPPVTSGFPAPLVVYPFFAYFAPGAHLLPPSPFSVALAVAVTLRAHCRFEAALKWYEIAFNPLKQDNTWAQCPDDDSDDHPSDDNVGSDLDGIIAVDSYYDRRNDLPCCPSEPVSDDVARDRSITLHYLETLLRWGDALMCRNSPEAFQQATVIFNTLEEILGAHPITVFAHGEGETPMTLAGFIPRPAPLNPRLMALYGRAADRLALVHHCLNRHRLRNGRPNIDMPYWGNSTLRDGWQTTVHICQDEDDWCLSCCSAYRFVFLVQKALELAGDVRSLGAALLAAYEKGDAEYLASLRSTHERQLLHLALEVRQNQWREADWQLQALQKTMESAQTRKRYTDGLIQTGLISDELQYVGQTGVSLNNRTAANASEVIAQGMNFVPDFTLGAAGIAGTPVAINEIPVGTKLAFAFSTLARMANILADIANTNASLSVTEAGWVRREDEWRHQSEVIGIEIEQIERQLLAAERRRDIALRELNNHQRQLENAIEVQNFLRDKFTSHELYLFLQQGTAALHYQAYEVALHAARKAQKAFNYESGHTARTFLPDDAWDNLHEGLMAGERLYMAVREMERAYLDANCRDYELTKHISLRLHFPFAFLHLKTTGYCEIEIPEWMFDLDYPGHYMRRIKNVTLTIPCVVGPYTGVHCRVTLLSSMTRVDPRLNDPVARCCGEPKLGMRLPDDCCSASLGPITETESERLQPAYLTLPDDPRIVQTYAATEAIATSNGQNDSGMFELSFRDERYLPFEFGGAISRWRIELPPENNYFDMESLSDVVLHLNYTAREGGELLRRAANEVAQKNLPGAGVRLFDMRRDFPAEWQQFESHSDDSSGAHRHGCCRNGETCEGCSGHAKSHVRYSRRGEWPRFLCLGLSRDMFPYLPCHRDVSITRLELLFEASGAIPSAHHLVQFLAHQKGRHLDEEAWRCDAEDVPCVASAEWPCLYHGVLDIKLGPLCSDGERHLGTFRFPPNVCDISRIYLICRYEIASAVNKGDLWDLQSCESGKPLHPCTELTRES